MSIDIPKAKRTAKLVNYYMTPFAVALVAMAALSAGLTRVTLIALGIIAFTAVGNSMLIGSISRFPSKFIFLRNVRVGFNYAFNILLVYLLYPIWRPVWMLFLLTVLAVAVYDTHKATIRNAAMLSLMFFSIQYARGMLSRPLLAESAMYVAALWVLGLFVNHLAHVHRSPS